MTPTFFITLMLSFGAVCAIGLWLIERKKKMTKKETIMIIGFVVYLFVIFWLGGIR